MEIEAQDREAFCAFIRSRETWLMERILAYAEARDYTRYTSTLVEAWRLSIVGLNDAMCECLALSPEIRELGPDDTYRDDPGARFGILEAQRHRSRGVNLGMFLGLMKYYRQCYLDLLREDSELHKRREIAHFIQRFFDRTEIAYCSEWAGLPAETQIHELSEANLRLTNEKNKYLTLFESLSSPVLLLDTDGCLDYSNLAAAESLLGVDAAERRYYEHPHPSSLPPYLEEQLEGLVNLSHVRLTVKAVDSGLDADRVYDVHIERMHDVSRKFSGYTVLFSDITERTQWADQMVAVNRNQEQLIAELKTARAQLEHSERLAAIGQLAAGVAHEINNPVGFCRSNVNTLDRYVHDLLQVITQYEVFAQSPSAQARSELQRTLQRVELDYLREDALQLITETRDGLDRVKRIVEDLKSLARSDGDDREDIDINDEIRHTLSVVWNELKYHTEVVQELEEVPLVRAVPHQVGQVMMNLLLNAAQAIEGHGVITVRSGSAGEQVWFEVQDTGKGILPEHIPHLFDPFFTTKPVGKGTGLGLSVSHGIVEKHGGTITVQSNPGDGSVFHVSLPVAGAKA